MRSFDDMDRTFREMDRMFDDLRSTWWGQGGAPALEAPSTPAHGGDDAGVSLEEEEGEFVLVMDLPGFEREEIELTFDDGGLAVRADREERDSGHSRRSRRTTKHVRIPGEVTAEEITATYRNGVLEVRLPIEEHSEGHHIEIE